jgi:general secretion pathway protein G
MLLTTVKKSPSRVARRAAFTLLEVLVVVAILVILASIAVIATQRYLEDAKKARAVMQAKSIHNALTAYMTNAANPYQEPPQSLYELVDPSQTIGGSSLLKNGSEDLLDPWGKEYQVLEITTDGQTKDYCIYTIAPDGTPISQFGIGPALSKVNQGVQ